MAYAQTHHNLHISYIRLLKKIVKPVMKTKNLDIFLKSVLINKFDNTQVKVNGLI